MISVRVLDQLTTPIDQCRSFGMEFAPILSIPSQEGLFSEQAIPSELQQKDPGRLEWQVWSFGAKCLLE